MAGVVVAVSVSPAHTMTKQTHGCIRLLAGLGVDRRRAHLGETVRHRSRVRQDPTRLNLRQVPLVRAELHDELRAAGFRASAGQMGENVTTRGTDLLGLPPGTTLRLGEAASVEVTGLRSPCRQLDSLQRGLMKAVLDRDERGQPRPQGRHHWPRPHRRRVTSRGRDKGRPAPRTAPPAR